MSQCFTDPFRSLSLNESSTSYMQSIKMFCEHFTDGCSLQGWWLIDQCRWQISVHSKYKLIWTIAINHLHCILGIDCPYNSYIQFQFWIVFKNFGHTIIHNSMVAFTYTILPWAICCSVDSFNIQISTHIFVLFIGEFPAIICKKLRWCS